MSATTAQRRTLKFDSLDDVMPDVERLLAGHVTVGKWTLGEICDHLATTMGRALDGFPKPAPWIVRRTIGPFFLKKILKEGGLSSRINAPKVLMPRPGTDARAGAEALRAAIQRIKNAPDPPPENAFFGHMSKDQLLRLQTTHCAHHLSFAVPTS